jgi:nucleotide-binding universal stress UspA family protein
MAQFRHIAVPVDFSEASAKALRYGLSLALEMEARLTLAHVIPFAPALAYVYPLEGRQVSDAEIEGVRLKLEELIPTGYRDAVRANFIVKAGDVQDELLSLIAAETPDLVAMGTHGRRRFQRWILGSVTESLLRRARVPILTVARLDDEHRIDKPMPVRLAKIVYATDLSSESVEGVRRALALAEDFSADLVILHAVQNLGWALGSEFIPVDPESRTVQAREAAFEYLVNSVPEAARENPKVRIELREGIPYEVILDFAHSENADLIVLNTQSRSGIDRAILGSTAERVVRGARVPVLSVPGTDSR